MHQFGQRVLLATFGAALAAAPVAAFAQDTTTTRVTSERRIPVRKGEARVTTESRGTVVPDSAAIRAEAEAARLRQDSIDTANRLAAEAAARDSMERAEAARLEAERVAQMRQDSIMRADSVARAEQMARDAVAAAERARRLGRFGGATFRLGAGASIPTGTTNDAYKTGFNGLASIGWEPVSWPIGVRVDGAYDRLTGRDITVGAVTSKLDNVAVWSATGEATLKVPNLLGLSPYLLGGAGVYRFTNYGAGNGIPGAASTSSNEFGWNAGAGITFGWGMTNLFLESRYTRIATDNVDAKWVPVVLGISFR